MEPERIKGIVLNDLKKRDFIGIHFVAFVLLFAFKSIFLHVAISHYLIIMKMNRVEPCMHNKCMGLYGNLTP